MSQSLEIYGHRGFAGLFPENTLIGYKEALKIGVNSLDIDVALTKDNIVVASHDPFLNKNLTRFTGFTELNGDEINNKWLRDNNTKIINLNFVELQQYDVGSINPASFYSQKFPLQKKFHNITIPSLENIIDLIAQYGQNHIKIQIEIKTNPKRDNQEFIQRFVDAIILTLNKKNFILRSELQSFDWRTLLYAQKIAPNIKTAYITEQSLLFNTFADVAWTAGNKLEKYDNSIAKMISDLGGSIWCPNYRDLTKSLVTAAHSYNLKVVPWTADTEQEFEDLIQFGVDGIITNRPDLLRNVMLKLGMVLPPSMRVGL